MPDIRPRGIPLGLRFTTSCTRIESLVHDEPSASQPSASEELTANRLLVRYFLGLAAGTRSRLPPAAVLLRAGVHAYDPGRELPHGLHQVCLGGHHPVDVLVGGGRLVEGAPEQCDPLLLQVLSPGTPVELLESPRPAHTPPCPVGGAVH